MIFHRQGAKSAKKNRASGILSPPRRKVRQGEQGFWNSFTAKAQSAHKW